MRKPYDQACARYHHPEPDLGYMRGIDDAEARMARGETQLRCPQCSLWVWESFFHHLPGEPVVGSVAGKQYVVGYQPDTASEKVWPALPDHGPTCLCCAGYPPLRNRPQPVFPVQESTP